MRVHDHSLVLAAVVAVQQDLRDLETEFYDLLQSRSCNFIDLRMLENLIFRILFFQHLIYR